MSEQVPKPAWAGNRPRMPAQSRLSEISNRVLTKGSVTVSEIVRDFGVSHMTARRDLAELERNGLLERVHGGAIHLSGPEHELSVQDESPYAARARRNAPAKERIAHAAAEIVGRHQSIAMDVGTTTHLVAQHLEGAARHRIFTNSLRIAEVLSDSPNEVYLPGGRIRHDELSVMGPIAVEQFRKLFFDISLIGISGVTADGLFDFSIEDVELKQVYIERSGCRVVLCDSSKFSKVSLVKVCDWNEISVFITDAEPSGAITKALRDAGVELMVVP